MQLVTENDGIQALAQLSSDLSDTANQLSAAANGLAAKQSSTYSPFGSALNGGTADVISSAAATIQSLVVTESGLMTTLLMDGDPTTPLTAQQMSALQALQQAVIDSRSSVGSIVSNVDWTYGNLFDDTITSIENDASQAYQNAKKALTPSWSTWLLVGVGIAIVVVLYRSL